MSKLYLPTESIFFFPLIISSSFKEDLIEELLTDLKIQSRVDYIFPDTELSKNPISYYEKEMGTGLSRIVIFDTTPRDRSEFVALKVLATELEQKYNADGQRTINIDVGRLSLESMELASGKMYSHRVYLDRGVYSDLHYLFKDKKYIPTPWCYPDYSQEQVLEFFTFMRTCR